MTGDQLLRTTRADQVYALIRADIFAARLEPGQRLKFPEICLRYDTSVGVAREALARLAVERLVRPQAHQGYTVAPLSVDELMDLTEARLELESLTFRAAIQSGGVQWEADIVSTHHVLSRLPIRHSESSDEEWEGWYRAHEAFHHALLAGCPNRRLRETAQAFRDEGELYRRWSAPLGGATGRDVAAEHQMLMDAALARKVEPAAELLREHIATTTRNLLHTLATKSDGTIVSASEVRA